MASTRLSHASNGVKATLMSQIDLPSGECAFIIDKAVIDSFPAVAAPDRRYVIEAMGALIQDIRKDGSVGHLIKLGIVDPQKYDIYQSIDTARFKYDLLLELHWKVIQCMRVSTASCL